LEEVIPWLIVAGIARRTGPKKTAAKAAPMLTSVQKGGVRPKSVTWAEKQAAAATGCPLRQDHLAQSGDRIAEGLSRVSTLSQPGRLLTGNRAPQGNSIGSTGMTTCKTSISSIRLAHEDPKTVSAAAHEQLQGVTSTTSNGSASRR
jgi:hypothetical protein